MQATVLNEPLLEFGYSGKHQEQRAGLAQNGPADIEMPGRKDDVRVGLVGPARMLDELEMWLQNCARGVTAKSTDLITLFPEFPGCTRDLGFRSQLTLPGDARRSLTKARLRSIMDVVSEQSKLSAAVHLCAEEVIALLERTPVDVVMVVRPRRRAGGGHIGRRDRRQLPRPVEGRTHNRTRANTDHPAVNVARRQGCGG
jgi:hypothetical protein